MAAPTPVLEVTGLTKHFPAFTLNAVSFHVNPGSITGFIGRNGAGKTTTLACLEGALQPDAGSIRVFGEDFFAHAARLKQRVAYELGGASYYQLKRLSQVAGAVARFYPSWDAPTFDAYCQQFSLDPHQRVGELSQGMRVKFALALALSRHAELFILDEPTSGLDPASREEVLAIFRDLVAPGDKAVLFSTHLASDLEKCAHDLIFIRAGRVVSQAPITAFVARYALVTADAEKTYGLAPLGRCTSAQGERTLVARGAAEATLAARGVDAAAASKLLERPSLDAIMACDPES
jgi:ABC-2 type transport system ATP-binding protein